MNFHFTHILQNFVAELSSLQNCCIEFVSRQTNEAAQSFTSHLNLLLVNKTLILIKCS